MNTNFLPPTDATFRPAVAEAVIAGCLAFVICAIGASQMPLVGQDEARFAQAAREMSAGGEWIVPSFGDEPRYDKPILIYWLTMLSYSIFGISAWAARLPSQIAAAVLVTLIAYWARRRSPRGGGLLAGLLMLACPVFFVEAQASTADMVMLLPTMLAVLLLEGLWAGRGTRVSIGSFWVLMALSVLAKGPIGPAVVLATLVALWAFERTWVRWERFAALGLLVLGYGLLGPVVLIVPIVPALISPNTRARIKFLRPLWGVPLFLALVMPWALAAHLQSGGDYFAEALGHHVFERGFTALESHGGFPGFYLVTAMAVLFPWYSGLLSRLRNWREVREDWTSLFFASCLIGTFVMLEMMLTRMVHYLLPCVVAGVLLLIARPYRGHAVIVGIGALALALLPMTAVGIFDLEMLRIPSMVVLVPLFVGIGLFIFWGRQGGGWRPLAVVATASLVFLMGLVGYFMPMMAETFIVGRTAAEVGRHLKPGEELVVYKLRDDELLFALPLHTRVERTRDGFTKRIRTGANFLGIAREKDLQALIVDDREFPFEIVESVEGIDLSRGRWAKNVFFRVAP